MCTHRRNMIQNYVYRKYKEHREDYVEEPHFDSLGSCRIWKCCANLREIVANGY